MSKGFLGRGWKFPVAVDPITGKIALSEYEDDIKESIRIILLTFKGERIMHLDFGCSIGDYVFETKEVTVLSLMESQIKDTLIKWEPRITDIQVQAQPDQDDPGKLLINVRYVVRTTNNLFNLVYPFYLKEGIK
jgi:phage baseplate assembly protein W